MAPSSGTRRGRRGERCRRRCRPVTCSPGATASTTCSPRAGAGRFWRAHDLGPPPRTWPCTSSPRDDDRAPAAARGGAPHRRPSSTGGCCGSSTPRPPTGAASSSTSGARATRLDILLTREGPLPPRRAAWIVAEVADSLGAGPRRRPRPRPPGRPRTCCIDQHGAGPDHRLRGRRGAARPARGPASRRRDRPRRPPLRRAHRQVGRASRRSAVPPAPEEHGEVLRPRRVRAGIPRVLDALCDQVLNHGGSDAGTISATVIADLLRDYVGDSLRAAGAGWPRHRHPPGRHTASSALPRPRRYRGRDRPDGCRRRTSRPAWSRCCRTPSADRGRRPRGRAPTSGRTCAEHGRPRPACRSSTTTHDVDWLRRAQPRSRPRRRPSTSRPPKPLFAPDPPDGQPARRPRPGSRAAAARRLLAVGEPPRDRPRPGPTGGPATPASASGSWTTTWDTGDGSTTRRPAPGAPGSGSRCSSSLSPAGRAGGRRRPTSSAVPPTTDGSGERADARAPRRRRAADPVRRRHRRRLRPAGHRRRARRTPTGSPSPSTATPRPSWSTSSYDQNFGPAGLKTGVGLVLDLGATTGVRQVDVTTVGWPTSLCGLRHRPRPHGRRGPDARRDGVRHRRADRRPRRGGRRAATSRSG